MLFTHSTPGGGMWSTFLFLFLSWIPLLQSASRQWSPREVKTKLGFVRGFVFLPKGYEGVEIFLGIPYASPPLGSLRFMPPVSGAPWTDSKMNAIPAPVCPQVVPNIRNETEVLQRMPKGRFAQLKRLVPLLKNYSEDCLYLNIYVPLTVVAGKAAELLPVLVFIHGDDFGYGAGHTYDPSMLCSQGEVLVVTMNYRLGILGFFNANAEGYFNSPANFAMLDQIAALHWIQENIEAFGGDPHNVTLMGHGKGAMFVNFLMISSAVPSRLLFHRVILMSGSALSPLAAGIFNGKLLAKKFAMKVRCPFEPPSTMLQCLREIPVQSFLESELWSHFGPSADGIVIEEEIRENILRDRLGRYPLMFGATKAEMLHELSDYEALHGLEVERRREILKEYVGKYYSIHRNEILAAAVHEYTDWERPIQHQTGIRDETLDALADSQIVSPLSRVGDLHSQGNSKSFFYVFEYQSRVSDYLQRLGCVHGEDLTYVFGVPLYYYYGNEWNTNDPQSRRQDGNTHLGFFTGNFTRSEVQLSQMVMLLWTHFMRTGRPTPERLLESPDEDLSKKDSVYTIPGFGSFDSSSRLSKNASFRVTDFVDWPPYDSNYKRYLIVDMKLHVKSHYRAHKLAFWLHLVPDLQDNNYESSPAHNHAFRPTTQSYPVAQTYPNPNSGFVLSPPNFHPENITVKPTVMVLFGSTQDDQESTNKNQGVERGHSSIHHIASVEGLPIYSTALSVTIAIGCSLLVLNLLIFATFYYKRDRRRLAAEARNRRNCHRASSSSAGTFTSPNYAATVLDEAKYIPSSKRNLSYALSTDEMRV